MIMPPGKYITAGWGTTNGNDILEGTLNSRPLTFEAGRLYYVGHLRIILWNIDWPRFAYEARVSDESDEVEGVFRKEYPEVRLSMEKQIIQLTPGQSN